MSGRGCTCCVAPLVLFLKCQKSEVLPSFCVKDKFNIWWFQEKIVSLSSKPICGMERSKVIERIKALARTTLPPHSALWLYGSQARGDVHEGSDWDLLILLEKPALEASDYGVAYPFRKLGWEIGEEVNPSLYTKVQWESWTYLPYYKNVERDKQVLL